MPGSKTNSRSLTDIVLLVNELALECIGVPAEDIPKGIVLVLQRCAEFMGAGGCCLFLYTEDKDTISVHQHWSTHQPSCPAGFGPTCDLSQLPWLAKQLNSGELVSIRALDDLPASAGAERKEFTELGIDSFYSLGLVSGKELLGAFALVNVPGPLSAKSGVVDGGDGSPALAEDLLLGVRPLLTKLLDRANPVTERLEALRSLVGGNTEAIFHNVIDSLTQGVSCCDNEGYVVYSNPSFERITGYKHEEIIGKRIYEFFFTPDSASYQASLEQQHQRYHDRIKGISEEYETQMVRKDGEQRWLQIKASPLRGMGGTIVGSIGVITDITERKMLEAQLLWSQKMEAVGRLAGGVAHDFNNLLTVINGYANLMLKRAGSDEKNRKQLNAIREAGEAACSLTQQLLTVSRRHVVQLKVLYLNNVVTHTTGIIRGLVGDEVELKTNLADGLPPVRMDASQIQQVVMNLAINARDAMPQGGQLTISTREERVTAPSGQIDPGDYVVLEVADTGLGMSEEVQSHLFEPFFTTKKAGTGLGLSVTYGIVEKHGGTIVVKSRRSHGTQFSVYLPRADTDEVELESQEFAVEPEQGSGTILLVEDEAAVRALVREVLVRGGYTVVEAVHGAEALEILARASGHFDMVLTDVAMPHVSGFELAEKLFQNYPKLRLLMVSGCTHDTSIPERINRYGIPFLAKPFTPDQLLIKVRDVMAVTVPEQTDELPQIANLRR